MKRGDIHIRNRPLTDPSTLGGRLYIARSGAKVAHGELATATGLGILTIHGLESGAITTTPANLERLAIALGVDPEWLARGRVAA